MAAKVRIQTPSESPPLRGRGGARAGAGRHFDVDADAEALDQILCEQEEPDRSAYSIMKARIEAQLGDRASDPVAVADGIARTKQLLRRRARKGPRVRVTNRADYDHFSFEVAVPTYYALRERLSPDPDPCRCARLVGPHWHCDRCKVPMGYPALVADTDANGEAIAAAILCPGCTRPDLGV